MEGIFGEQKRLVQCFYKGTPFPCVFTGTTTEWNDMWKKSFDESIVMGLRNGISLQLQNNKAKVQLDFMESILMEMCQRYDDKTLKVSRWKTSLEQEFVERCVAGGLFDTIHGLKVLWYMNVHLLVKTKVISDDKMNGWIMIGGGTDDEFLNIIASMQS